MALDLPDGTAELLVEEAASLHDDWGVIFETLFIHLGVDSALLDALVGWLEDNGPMRSRRQLGLVPGFEPESSRRSPRWSRLMERSTRGGSSSNTRR